MSCVIAPGSARYKVKYQVAGDHDRYKIIVASNSGGELTARRHDFDASREKV